MVSHCFKRIQNYIIFTEVDGGKPLIEQLKGTVQSKFDCTLKDEHKVSGRTLNKLS